MLISIVLHQKFLNKPVHLHYRKFSYLQYSYVHDCWSGLAPMCKPGGVGSTCELWFKTQRDLEMARSMIRGANIQHQGGRSKCWLDIKKTHAERRPTRVAKQLRDICWDELHRLNGQPNQSITAETEVTVEHKTRSVSVKGIKIAWLSRQSEAQWTTAGSAMFPTDTKKMIEDMAEGAL